MTFIQVIRSLLGCKCEEKDIEIVSLKTQLVEKEIQINSLNVQLIDIKKDIKLKEPVTYGIITLQEVISLLSDYGFKLNLSDEYFQVTTVDEATMFTRETKVQYRTWTKEDHDCDNFSFALLGYWSQGLKSFAFGYARSQTHAFNVMIDKDKVFWICEPQTNQWYKYKDIYKNPSFPQYQITEVLM